GHHVGDALHGAGVGLKVADQHAQERRLAGAIGADQADAVTAEDSRREILDDDAFAEALGNVARSDGERARLLRRADLDGGAAGRADLLTALLAQLTQGTQAALVTRAPGADALGRTAGL